MISVPTVLLQHDLVGGYFFHASPSGNGTSVKDNTGYAPQPPWLEPVGQLQGLWCSMVACGEPLRLATLQQ
eukprot:3250255-Amphidinium_carterae.1